MKQLKYTLKVCAQYWREWTKTLWRDYLLLALAATVVMVALLVVGRDTLLPLWVCGTEIGDWQLVMQLVPLSPVWLAVLVVGLVALGWCLVRGHLAMLGLVRRYSPVEMGRQQKAAVVTLLVMLMTLLMAVLWLPMVTLVLSTIAAAYSGMLQDNVPTPTWVWLAFALCGFAATLVSAVAMTFCRLCLRQVPERETPTPAEESDNDAATSEEDLEK